MFGWWNNFLQIDLTSKNINKIKISQTVFKKYLGGRGLGTFFLKDYYNKPPLSEEIIICILTGPLTGTSGYSSGRFSLVSRSPLTKTIFSSNSGGSFGYYLKKAGYDGIIIKGKSKKPIVIIINNDEVILDSSINLWGKNIKESFKLIPKNYKSIIIGKSGEKQNYFANIASSERNYFGRGGLGAIFGFKNLKGILVKGDKKISIANPKKFKKAQSEIKRMIFASPIIKVLQKYGTSSILSITDFMKILPVKNFKTNEHKQIQNLYSERIINETTKSVSCITCPIACKKKSKKSEFPEFETMAILGINNLVFDFKTIIKANKIANDYGLDTISLGGTLAAFYEYNGQFPGKNKLINDILEICENKRKGQKLSQGSFRFLEQNNSTQLSMSVKKLELPAYDPRGVKGMALSYGTSNRGACHLQSYMIGPEILRKPRPLNPEVLEGKAGYIALFQNRFAMLDSLSMCKFAFLAISEDEVSELLSGITGIDFNNEDLMNSGRFIWDEERKFNKKAGFKEKDDFLPERFFNEPGGRNLSPINKNKYKQELDLYYKIRGYKKDEQ